MTLTLTVTPATIRSSLFSGFVRGTYPETSCFGAKVHQRSAWPTYIQLRLFGSDIGDISLANAAHIYGKELPDSRFLSLTVMSSIGAPNWDRDSHFFCGFARPTRKSLSAQVLGFLNRWYPDALRTEEQVQLSGRLVIRAIDAPYFLGTKFEAFYGRGRHDYLASHDLEDFVVVVDGRSSPMTEVESASSGQKM